jgi:hypothetical protein
LSNEELQYYPDDTTKAANVGNGNLVLTLREPESLLECYYGTCEYTSARLVSRNKAKFAYSRPVSSPISPACRRS